jgi:hypothetical protein
VAIRSISPEGAGIAFSGPPCALERRSTVTMSFRVDSHTFDIPGQIVWTAGTQAARSPVEVGIRFQLAAVPNETRQAYARWIVELLRRAGAPGHS